MQTPTAPTIPEPVERQDQEPYVNGVPHCLLDGYDGDGALPPAEYIQVAGERAALDFGTLPPEDALRFRATGGMPASWVLIENDGALFRGPARGLPREVWSPQRQAFAPYTGSHEKSVGWGDIIGVDEAMVLMRV